MSRQLETEYQPAYEIESVGRAAFGVKILTKSDHELTNEEGRILRKAAEESIEAMKATSLRSDPAEIAAIAEERTDLLGLFADPIYVEEIPNGYCSMACCRHRPWFRVTTRRGRIELGWRKSVIEISWEKPVGEMAEALFPTATSTKVDRTIHAWRYEDARAIIATLQRGPDSEATK